MGRYCVVVLSLLTAFGLVASNNLARAADFKFCSDYESTAADKVKLAKQFNCGFTGPRWIKNADTHLAWCLIADQNAAQAETDARATDLKGCTCQWYADQTMVQIATNIANKCGFTGLRWIDDKKAHYDWCANFNPGLPAMMGEMEARKAQLKGC